MSKSLNRKLPAHVAIVMDGNGRWAKKRRQPRLFGHHQGAVHTRDFVEMFAGYGIPYLTLYAFSTENWNRPEEEVRGIFKLLEDNLDEAIEIARSKDIRIRHLGSLEGLSPLIRDKARQAMQITENNKGLTVSIAFNYGGRSEIVNATRRIILAGTPADEVDENLFSSYLYSAGIPDPDLIIRTGGEFRLSNYLIWQSAYSELYFTPVLWPDFDGKELDKALADYSKRQRRFGRVKSA